MKLSVIVPIYQAEDTLPQCLDSILQQHVDDLEMILVDDGSSDNSLMLCQEYASQHSLIKVIHQNNGGTSSARNTGLDNATGEYITFVDSDDLVAPDTYQQLLTIATKHPEYDFIEYSVVEKSSEKDIRPFLILHDKSYTDLRDYWLSTQGYLHTFVWNKIYRRDIFQNLRFQSGAEPFEDYALMNQLLPLCKTIHTTSRGSHLYNRSRSDSISFSPTGSEMTFLLHESLKMLERFADRRFYEAVLNIQIVVYELTQRQPLLPVMPFFGSWKQVLMHTIGMRHFCQIMRLARKILHKTK